MIRVLYRDVDDHDGLSLEQIGAELHMPQQLVRRLEQNALIKIRIGLMVVELLGRERADAVLASLNGRALLHWRRALADARVRSGRPTP